MPGKWIFSTWLRRLLLLVLVFPQTVHLLAPGPPSGNLTMYSYSALSPARDIQSRPSSKSLFSLERQIGTMAICYMVVQQILCWESFQTILACVSEQSRKVNIFDMLPQVGFVSTDFPTNCAFECLLPSFQVADNVSVKLLVATCNQQSSATVHFYYGILKRACSGSFWLRIFHCNICTGRWKCPESECSQHAFSSWFYDHWFSHKLCTWMPLAQLLDGWLCNRKAACLHLELAIVDFCEFLKYAGSTGF